MPSAPIKFTEWMSSYVANDKKFGRKIFRYHPRSDQHSKLLCALIFNDLMEACPSLRKDITEGRVVCGINSACSFPNGKTKTLDLAIGEPLNPVLGLPPQVLMSDQPIKDVRISCEAKQAMTEHQKSKPRLFDELSSSHEIVHQGVPKAIATGIVVVNIASVYASPTRQTSRRGPPVMTKHRQPDVTKQMVDHLRGLKVRDTQDGVGFDAFAQVVLDCDNIGACRLHTDPPAPQPGDRDHYDSFIQRISKAYEERFGTATSQ